MNWREPRVALSQSSSLLELALFGTPLIWRSSYLALFLFDAPLIWRYLYLRLFLFDARWNTIRCSCSALSVPLIYYCTSPNLFPPNFVPQQCHFQRATKLSYNPLSIIQLPHPFGVALGVSWSLLVSLFSTFNVSSLLNTISISRFPNP